MRRVAFLALAAGVVMQVELIKLSELLDGRLAGGVGVAFGVIVGLIVGVAMGIELLPELLPEVVVCARTGDRLIITETRPKLTTDRLIPLHPILVPMLNNYLIVI